MLYELHARMHALTFHQVTAQAVMRPYPNLSLISQNASTFPSCAYHRSLSSKSISFSSATNAACSSPCLSFQ